MDATAASNDSFVLACQRLEQIAELKEKGVLDTEAYEHIRGLLIQELKQSATAGENVSREYIVAVTPQKYDSLPYGQLHAQIVTKLTVHYESAGSNDKQRMYSAMSEMAESQALYPGDTTVLSQLIDVVFSPTEVLLGDATGDAAGQMLELMSSTHEVAARIRSDGERSPAAKAIADTAQQSATHAAAQFNQERKRADAKNRSLKQFWGKYVLKDVMGAFEGGAAAVTIAGAFAPVAPMALPVAAAFGVLIGGGAMSALAHAGSD